MLDELLAADGVRETCRLEGEAGFMALHGGLETATFEIASAAAMASGSSLYSVRQPWSLYWHVPSIQFDPAHSPALRAFLGHVGLVFSRHGFGRPGLEKSVLLGGCNRALAGGLAEALRGDGFDVVDTLDLIPEVLRGTHARNPVNLTEHGGVQIEIGSDLRKDETTTGRLAGVLAAVASGEMRSPGPGPQS